jgi:hypothetical protein
LDKDFPVLFQDHSLALAFGQPAQPGMTGT